MINNGCTQIYGSKNKLAERIVRLLPKRTHLVDLFCEETRECSLVCSKQNCTNAQKCAISDYAD